MSAKQQPENEGTILLKCAYFGKDEVVESVVFYLVGWEGDGLMSEITVKVDPPDNNIRNAISAARLDLKARLRKFAT